MTQQKLGLKKPVSARTGGFKMLRSRGFSNPLSYFPCFFFLLKLVVDVQKRTTAYSMIVLFWYQLSLYFLTYLGCLWFQLQSLYYRWEKEEVRRGCKDYYPSKAHRKTTENRGTFSSIEKKYSGIGI